MLLLDEPLGALDLKLRQEMQLELKRSSASSSERITFVYVTHDQDEALTMSDRIARLLHGRLEQVGTPGEIYEHPAQRVRGRLRRHVERHRARRPRYTIRPEKIRLLEDDDAVRTGAIAETGTVREVVYLGAVTRYVVELDDGDDARRRAAEPRHFGAERRSQRARPSRAAGMADRQDARRSPQTPRKRRPAS